MQKIIIFILLICLILSLYNFIFNSNSDTIKDENGEEVKVTFSTLYKNAMKFVTDIGNTFAKIREGILNSVEVITGLPEVISNFFSNIGESISSILEKLGIIADKESSASVYTYHTQLMFI